MTQSEIKKHAVDFCAWFMQLKVEELTYYIVEPGSSNPIRQYYSREEMYDKYIQLIKSQNKQHD